MRKRIRRCLTKKSLTPDELFECRVGLAFGMLPSMVRQIGASEYDLLLRYWKQEPWGPWRDNLHAAILAREVRRSWAKGPHELSDFMVIDPTQAKSVDKKGVLDFFKSVATRKKRKADKVKK